MTRAQIDSASKNWNLQDVVDRGSARSTCEYCGAHLRYEYHLKQKVQAVVHAIIVGSECVKGLTDRCEPAVAFNLLHDEWRQRRGYFYKRVFGIVCIIGHKGRDDRWYTALSTSVRSTWEFGPWFTSAEDAKLYFAQVSGGLKQKAVQMAQKAALDAAREGRERAAEMEKYESSIG